MIGNWFARMILECECCKQPCDAAEHCIELIPPPAPGSLGTVVGHVCCAIKSRGPVAETNHALENTLDQDVSCFETYSELLFAFALASSKT